MSSGKYGIIAPIPVRLVDLLMSMGLKDMFFNSWCNLEGVVCAFMRNYYIAFDRMWKDIDLDG